MLKIFKSYLKVFTESKYVLYLNIADRVFFFVIFVLIAREYPIEIYGKLITLFAISNVFITIFDLGLPIYLQREISVSKIKSSQLFSQIFVTNLYVFIAYFASAFIFYELLYADINLGLFLSTIVFAYLISLININQKVLSALKKFKEQFQINIKSRLLIIILYIPAIMFFKIGIPWLLTMVIVGFLYNIFLLIRVLEINHVFFSFKLFNYKQVKSILKVSFPLGLAVIFNFLYDKVDVLLISKLADFTQVAFYNVGYGLYKTSTLSFSFLLVAGLTKISYLSRNKIGIRLFLRKYLKIFSVICLLIFLILFLGAEFMIKIIYTNKFDDSILIVKILSFAILGLALNNLTGVVLTGIGLFKENMIVTMIGLLLNVILNIIFIPLYGIIACAIITIITEYFIFTGDIFFLNKFLKR